MEEAISMGRDRKSPNKSSVYPKEWERKSLAKQKSFIAYWLYQDKHDYGLTTSHSSRAQMESQKSVFTRLQQGIPSFLTKWCHGRQSRDLRPFLSVENIQRAQTCPPVMKHFSPFCCISVKYMPSMEPRAKL